MELGTNQKLQTADKLYQRVLKNVNNQREKDKGAVFCPLRVYKGDAFGFLQIILPQAKQLILVIRGYADADADADADAKQVCTSDEKEFVIPAAVILAIGDHADLQQIGASDEKEVLIPAAMTVDDIRPPFIANNIKWTDEEWADLTDLLTIHTAESHSFEQSTMGQT